MSRSGAWPRSVGSPPNDPRGGALWLDPLVLLALLAEVALVLLYALRPASLALPPPHSTAVFLALLLAALAVNRQRAPDGETRRYWTLWLVAVAAWSVQVAGGFLPAPAQELHGFALATDILYLLFYLFAFLAVLQAPPAHLSSPDSETRFFAQAAPILFVFGCLVYFVVIPSWSSPAEYARLLPSYLMYTLLDTALVISLGLAFWKGATPRWRRYHGGLALAFAATGSIDLMDTVGYALGTPVKQGGALDLLWFGGLGTMIVAVRYGGLAPGKHDPESATMVGAATASPDFWTWGLLLPLVHAIGYGLGILDPVSRLPREICLGGVVLLTAAVARAYRGLAEPSPLDVAQEQALLAGRLDELLEDSALRAVDLHRLDGASDETSGPGRGGDGPPPGGAGLGSRLPSWEENRILD